ncbi:multidrug resistance protein, MATE family, partial [Phenoliferia sp. Uapishka_3]
MFSNYPGSSPSSFPADTSFLQRAASAGQTSLSPSSYSEPRGRSTTHEQGGNRGASRSSLSSSYSVGGTRLSPTRELDSETENEEESDVDASAFEVDVDGDEDGGIGGTGHYAQAGMKPAAYSHSHTLATAATEQTPLLSGFSLRGAAAEVVPAEDTAGPSAARQELGILLGYMLPICGTHFLEYSLLVVTVVSVGHIGTVELAAASLASMTSNVVALSVIQGSVPHPSPSSNPPLTTLNKNRFCTALDTLCPQAYTSRPKDTSLYALRTFFLLLLLIIPQIIIFWNSEVILLALKQDPRVAERASTYLKVLGFGLPGYAGFECVRRWLQSQGLMLAPVLTLIVAAPLNVILNYILVWGPDSVRIGFVGAPLATAISMNSMFIVSMIYAYFYAPRDAWGGFSWAIVHDLGINIRLGLAGTAMVASEWWCWEIVGLASSFLGPTTLAAQSILLTSASLFYQIPYALSVAGAVRVGNDVIQLVAGVLPLVALFQLADGLSGAAGGLLRGAGRATLGALINLTSYYVVGLPLGLILAFLGPKLGLFGLWIGLTAALAFTAGLMTFYIWRMNWEHECELTRMRMGLVKRDGVEEA